MAPIFVVRIASLVYANLSSGAVDHVLDVGDMLLVVRLRPDDDPSSSDALANSVASAVDVGGTCPSSGRLAQLAALGELDVAKFRDAEDVSDEFSGEAKAARANNGNPEDRPVPPLIRSFGRARCGLRALPLRFPACRGSAYYPVLDGLGLVDPALARREMDASPGLKSQAREIADGMRRRFTEAARSAVGHRDYLDQIS